MNLGLQMVHWKKTFDLIAKRPKLTIGGASQDDWKTLVNGIYKNLVYYYTESDLV